MGSVEERVFFVTGATSGIGEFTAELLAKERLGWDFLNTEGSGVKGAHQRTLE